MTFKTIAVTAAATALCLGLAGPALAAPLSMAKSAPQVTGTRLQSALLPASAFGDSFAVTRRLNSGSQLRSTRVIVRPSGLSCATFENSIYVWGFGNTAGAADVVSNQNPTPFGDYPNVVLGAAQTVLQFKTTKAAASLYHQAYTKYKQCSAFTEPDPADNTNVKLTTLSLYRTTIDHHKAFRLIQLAIIDSLPALPFYENTAVVLAGANVYTILDLGGTSDPISATLLGNLIDRVQALYRHH